MNKDDFVNIPIPWVTKQNLFSDEQIIEMHNGIKYCNKLEEYFKETKEKLRLMHPRGIHHHSEEELDAGTAVLLTWPFLGKEVLDEETVFTYAEIILSLLGKKDQN